MLHKHMRIHLKENRPKIKKRKKRRREKKVIVQKFHIPLAIQMHVKTLDMDLPYDTTINLCINTK